jgi:hypothetical protein
MCVSADFKMYELNHNVSEVRSNILLIELINRPPSPVLCSIRDLKFIKKIIYMYLVRGFLNQ